MNAFGFLYSGWVLLPLCAYGVRQVLKAGRS